MNIHEIDKRLSNYFLPYQQKWILDDSPMKLYPKSRRIGITFATSYRAHRKCLLIPGTVYWVTSRDEPTAKQFISEYIRMWAQASNATCKGLAGEDYVVIDPERGIRAFTVRYENGSQINSISSTPEAFAGKGGHVLADELDLHRDPGKLIDMAMPVTTWGYSFEAVSALAVDGGPSTPFCKLWDGAKGDNPMGWSLHETTILDAVEQGFVEKINEVSGSNYTREAWLKMMRARCRTEEAWNTQYMLIPSSDSGAMLPYEMIMACEHPEDVLKRIVADAGDRIMCFGGYDVARHKDLAIYSEFALIGNVLYQKKFETLAKTKYRVQEDFLIRQLEENPYLVKLGIDRTGNGDMLYEYLADRFGEYRVEGIHFSLTSKNVMATGLRASCEDRLIRFFENEQQREGLHKVQKVRTPGGKITYNAEADEEGHGDEFWAAAIARYVANSASAGPVRAVPLRDVIPVRGRDAQQILNAIDDEKLQPRDDWSSL